MLFVKYFIGLFKDFKNFLDVSDNILIAFTSTIKGAELSYDLEYVILFWSWISSEFCGYICILWIYPSLLYISILCGYYPHFVEISTFCGYYPHFLDISAFRGYYPHFLDIPCIVHITSYLARNVRHVLHSLVLVMDFIYIGHITSYLAHNVCTIFYIYSSSVSDWCITYFTVCNLICFSVPSDFRLVFFVSEYKINPNLIWIYMPPFITSIKASSSFPLNF